MASASMDIGALDEASDRDGNDAVDSGVDEGAFRRAAQAVDVKPLENLAPKWRRKPRATVALEPAEREARSATLKLRAREQDVGLKRLLAWVAISAVILQLLVADAFLAYYVLWDTTNPSDAVLIAWLSASVVEVIGIVAIVARNLFPNRSKPLTRRRRRKRGKN